MASLVIYISSYPARPRRITVKYFPPKMAEDLSHHGQVLICNTESSSVIEKSIKHEFFGSYNTPEESN